MERAIRNHVIPVLRSKGFTGSFPHLRRATPTRIELLTFQFRLSGGSFVVEIATCEAEGITNAWRHVPPNKVTAHDVMPRHRLGSNAATSDYWFVFGKSNYEAGFQIVEPEQHYVRVAEKVLATFSSEAAAYWDGGT